MSFTFTEKQITDPYRRRATLHDLVYTPESLAHVRERVPRLKEIMKRREQELAASG